MRLVVDTTIIIAALIRDSVTRLALLHPEMEYLVPEFSFEEVEANKNEILEKSGMTAAEIDILLEQLKSRLIIVPTEDITQQDEAANIMDSIDPEDTIFIALALSTNNDGIWSEDNHFKQQNAINILKTKDLLRRLDMLET